MVRAVQLNGVVDLVRQVEAVLGEEGQEGVEPLLQVALGIDQAVDRRRVAGSALVAAQRFAPGLALDFAELVADLAQAAVGRFRERRVEADQLTPQALQRRLRRVAVASAAACATEGGTSRAAMRSRSGLFAMEEILSRPMP